MFPIDENYWTTSTMPQHQLLRGSTAADGAENRSNCTQKELQRLSCLQDELCNSRPASQNTDMKCRL
jgi:hypothetical protein